MPSMRTASILVTIVLSFGMEVNANDQAAAPQQPAARLAFPADESEEHWKLRSFWPMDTAYGWDVPNVPVGSYRLVIRYGSNTRGKSPLSAKEATEEYSSEKPFVFDKGVYRGYVSFQLVDFSALGLDVSEHPVRVRVVFSLKGSDGSVRLPLTAKVFGGSVSRSPVSNPRWKNDELHFIGFTSKDPKTGITIRHNVFVVRDPHPSRNKSAIETKGS